MGDQVRPWECGRCLIFWHAKKSHHESGFFPGSFGTALTRTTTRFNYVVHAHKYDLNMLQSPNTLPYRGYIVSVRRMMVYVLVLLTRAASRGVTGLYPWQGNTYSIARTADHKIWKFRKKGYRRDILRSLRSWVSTIESVELTADVFHYYLSCHPTMCSVIFIMDHL